MISLNYNVIIELIIFLVMLYVLSKFLIGPVLSVVDARDEKINSMQSHADTLNQETESKIEDYEARMEEARNKAVDEREKIRKSAVTDEEDMLKKARTESADKIAELRERISGEYKEASEKLRQEGEAISKHIAKKILGRSLN